SIDLQTVHTAPEHHVGGGSLCLLGATAEQLVGAAGDHIHPDSRALLEFPDDGPPHLLLVGGIDHQAAPLLRREGGWAGVPAPRSAAGEQHPRSQPQRQPAYLFHIFHSSAGSSSSVLPNYSTFSFLFS